MAKVKTCLWFSGDAEEAVKLYTSLIPDSSIASVNKVGGGCVIIDFSLGGSPFQAMNFPTEARFTDAASIQVMTEDQEETDRLWAALTADGGKEKPCAWLTDKFGVSWQIVPKVLPQFIGGSDPAGAARANKAMMQMKKIEISKLEAAYKNEPE